MASQPAPSAPSESAVTELLALLAYGELSAFYRLAKEAELSPTLRGKVAAAQMASAEIQHFTRLRNVLEARGVDVYQAMGPYTAALDAYHRCTDPSTWLESMVKFHVGDGLAADFYREIAGALNPENAAVIRDVLAETADSQFVVEEVRAAVAHDRPVRDRLVLWGRRLLGEAITQAQYVIAQSDELTDLVMAATGDLGGVAALFERMQAAHTKRMAVLGL